MISTDTSCEERVMQAIHFQEIYKIWKKKKKKYFKHLEHLFLLLPATAEYVGTQLQVTS